MGGPGKVLFKPQQSPRALPERQGASTGPAVQGRLLPHHFVFYKFIYFILFYFIYFWLRWVFVAARRLSLVAASRGLLFIAVRGLLTAVASLVAEHGL